MREGEREGRMGWVAVGPGGGVLPLLDFGGLSLSIEDVEARKGAFFCERALVLQTPYGRAFARCLRNGENIVQSVFIGSLKSQYPRM